MNDEVCWVGWNFAFLTFAPQVVLFRLDVERISDLDEELASVSRHELVATRRLTTGAKSFDNL